MGLALRPQAVSPSHTEVALTYDWSAVPQEMRQHIGFPPFDVAHLDNSLKHLAELAEARTSPTRRYEVAPLLLVLHARHTLPASDGNWIEELVGFLADREAEGTPPTFCAATRGMPSKRQCTPR